ncbi:CRISPR-associated endonuclease Cas2 [Candidatus Geothermarchaeota archaeon]|nr:MAG: CRISPR-associated endonuclease Cas2 [Candidatus Geothermarchaeota archaeon]
MYIILVYDVGVERVNKVLKICRKYLTWVQNSVLEGEISRANYMKLKHQLSKVIEKQRDSILFYILRSTAYMSKERLGVVKGEPLNIL